MSSRNSSIDYFEKFLRRCHNRGETFSILGNSMNTKRTKYAAQAHINSNIKEEVNVPVLIHDPNAPDDEPQYAYATFATADEAQEAVASLQQRHHEIGAQEVIIDEHGRAVTIQELVGEENAQYVQVEEVETVEEPDGTHTILHIVPSGSADESEEIEQHDGGDSSIEDGGSIKLEIGGEGDSDGAHHSRSKTFYCTNCGNCYSAAGSLKLHMRACLRQREEVPPEQRKCHICNKVFNSVSYLKEHMMRHTGEGPRRCTRCYRKFVDEDKYKAHMEAHKQQDRLDAEAEALAAEHGGRKIVLKEFVCSFCSQNFTVAFDVGQVKRRYACDPCREKYSNAEALKQHKQAVEDKREFSCERCGRKFVFEGFLQRHLPVCDGTIKRRRDLKQ